jgi:serine/threonine protein kinase
MVFLSDGSFVQFEELRYSTNCPTFLIATAGPWIAILGAVITDGVIVQRLTDYIWVGLDSVLNESHITNVARIFYALKASLGKLDSYYEKVQPTGSLPADSRYFPSITAYPHSDGFIDFKYVGFLENCPDCTTLHARTTTEPAQDIVVKFVDRYGERAHSILADEGLAPKLFYYGSLHLSDEQPSYRSLSMVVMEYIDGKTLAQVKEEMNVQTTEKVRLELRRALALLHDHGLVFGDLRPPNVMITKAHEVKLIDFNWAGVEGQAKYPYMISPGIDWPEDVKALAVMKTDHDVDMLSKLFGKPAL